MQLFLLPFAGGNRYSYDFLLRQMDTNLIDSHPLELPGRGGRIDEKLIFNLEEAIADYLQQIQDRRTNDPYLIFGHSMGAVLGFQIVMKLEAEGDVPMVFIASGNSGPRLRPPEGHGEKLGTLTDEQLKAKLRKLGGISEKILGQPEIFDFFKTAIKADFAILDEEIFYENQIPKIQAPIHAMMGREEEKVALIGNWQYFTSAEFTYNIMDGNHFFIHHHPQEIISVFMALKQAGPPLP